MNGDTLLDQAKVEMIADCVEDYLMEPYLAVRRLKDEDEKVSLLRYSAVLL